MERTITAMYWRLLLLVVGALAYDWKMYEGYVWLCYSYLYVNNCRKACLFFEMLCIVCKWLYPSLVVLM